MAGRGTPEGPIEVLLVDDNPGDVRLTEEAFADLHVDCSVAVASRGDEALDVLSRRVDSPEASRPDVVLVDLNLPDTTGLEFLEEIRGSPALADLPVVLLTGSSAHADIVSCDGDHATASLTKPIDPDAFLDVVRSLRVG